MGKMTPAAVISSSFEPPTPSLTCSQTPSVTSTTEEEKAGGASSESFSFSLRHCLLPPRFPCICSIGLSADCALHGAVNTPSAAPVDSLQLEFVVGCCWARNAPRLSLSLSLFLNPMRWAFSFFEPLAGELTPVWPLVSDGLDCFYSANVHCLTARRRKTFFFFEFWAWSCVSLRRGGDRDVRTGYKNAQVRVELSAWGEERATFSISSSSSSRSSEWTTW